MRAGRASFVVAVVGVVASIALMSSPARATGHAQGQGQEQAQTDDDETLPFEGDENAPTDGPAECSRETHRCGAGPNFVCCEPGNQCCRHKGGVLYCAKKKCGPHQP
jgi:hypothetical protein